METLQSFETSPKSSQSNRTFFCARRFWNRRHPKTKRNTGHGSFRNFDLTVPNVWFEMKCQVCSLAYNQIFGAWSNVFNVFCPMSTTAAEKVKTSQPTNHGRHLDGTTLNTILALLTCNHDGGAEALTVESNVPPSPNSCPSASRASSISWSSPQVPNTFLQCSHQSEQATQKRHTVSTLPRPRSVVRPPVATSVSKTDRQSLDSLMSIDFSYTATRKERERYDNNDTLSASMVKDRNEEKDRLLTSSEPTSRSEAASGKSKSIYP